MWFYSPILYIILFLQIFTVVCKETIIIKASDESKQDILVDALRNFTTANKILKDLIQNYEHLQRIYKSKEEEEDSKKGGKSDTVHNMFKAIFSSGEGEKPRSKKKLQKYDKMRVTQMYLSDIESVEKSVDVESKSDDTSATETSDVIIGAINKIHKETKDSIKKSIENTPAQNKMKKFKKKGKESRDNTVTTVKTRFSIQDDRNKQYTTKHHVGPHFRNNHKSIKRLVYAEIFSPDKMWHEVVNKPVNLQVFNDGGINLRTIKRTNTDNLESEEAEDMVPDDEILMKEQIKGKILRDAYGDACVTVAVQKCYKALKLVSKSVCRFRKCKSGLKNNFMEFSKTGCIREFNSGNGIANSITIAKNIERAIQRMNDMSKYLKVYLPVLRYSNEVTEISNLQNEANDIRSIHILRDRFEKACKHLSMKKCVNACHYSIDETCKVHECRNNIKKAFIKECKRKCKSAYNVGDNDGSQSGSDSESESDESHSGSDY
ncbi:uncharacterized protein LOC126976002 [Leptidea sinapis]|uniref:uncharacterized protein LOC126976002 n=1 Tax=Leptidea sinapis TaxID=189913 RepID=UPI0021422A27|nr:uncharacterized protein LOC126976002 [Leptidea sinapis]